jgi:hypothetical protein
MPNPGEVITLAAMLLDAWPVGCYYTQYPATPTPQSLIGGTWSNVSSIYAGLFFRAEGGNAGAFNTSGVTTQAQDIQPHNHIQYTGGVDDQNFTDSLGQYPPGDTSNGPRNTGLVTGTTGGIETRPVNTTIRIWQRTA